MAVRITRTGTGVVQDHNDLANKGTRTHAEIDSYLQELDDARGNKPSLKDTLDELQAKDDDQTQQLDTLKNSVSAVQDSVNTVMARTVTLENKNQTQDIRLAQIEQKNAQQDQAILKLQSDVSSNPNAEVVAARIDRNGKIFPNLKSRLDEMQAKIGSGGGNSGNGGETSRQPLVDVVSLTNILRNAYRTLENGAQGASVRHHLYADAFVDGSGIDVAKSLSFQVTNGKFTKASGDAYNWGTLGVETASSVGDYNNSNTAYRPYKAHGTTPIYSVEKIADDRITAVPGDYKDYWLQAGPTADLFMKWESPVYVSKIILWMNGTHSGNGHHYCDHQIFVKEPSSDQWVAVTPRINLATPTDKGINGDGSWHYPVHLDYPINEVKVTVWNKSTYMTLTEVQILRASNEEPVMVSKPILLEKSPTHLFLDAEYEGSISLDLSLDGGITFKTGIPLNQLIDVSSLSEGTSLVLRAHLGEKAVLDSIGCIWYDEDTLPTYTDTRGEEHEPGTTPSLMQVEKFGVKASPASPAPVNITIPYTSDYKLPPIEVLKFSPGQKNYTEILASFDSDESANLDRDDYVATDGKLHLITSFTFELTEDTLPSGDNVYSFTIDATQFATIEKIEVT
ncbi:hypothetical protein AAFJ72_03105 [Brevibacillus gelatini]|uniref:hypothetical protein n=1 Tax=Brevibacillus gelatini TaxID=1655277 RepID=UPI003D813A33